MKLGKKDSNSPFRKITRYTPENCQKPLLKEQKAQDLGAEYEAAAAEIRRINRDLEGILNDGLKNHDQPNQGRR